MYLVGKNLFLCFDRAFQNGVHGNFAGDSCSHGFCFSLWNVVECCAPIIHRSADLSRGLSFSLLIFYKVFERPGGLYLRSSFGVTPPFGWGCFRHIIQPTNQKYYPNHTNCPFSTQTDPNKIFPPFSTPITNEVFFPGKLPPASLKACKTIPSKSSRLSLIKLT